LHKIGKSANILAMNNYMKFFSKTPNEINMDIAKRIKNIRKRKKISQIKLSEKTGVSLGSIKRFEQSGDISLKSLAKIAIVLNVNREMEDLFSDVVPESIEEIINEQRRKY